MKDPNKIAQLVVQAFLDRGVDFLIEEARSFTERIDLNKALKPSQLSHLQSLFQKNISNYAALKSQVKVFIEKKAEKDAKRNRKGWAEVGDTLYERLFNFTQEKNTLNKLIKDILSKSNCLPNDLRNSIDDLFNPRLVNPEEMDIKAKEWLENKLEPELSRRMLASLLAVYCCKKAKFQEEKL